MANLAIGKRRDDLEEALKRMRESGERVLLEKNGEKVAALVSVEDLQFLEELEDRLDLEAAREALKEPGSIPWEEVKADLGL